MRHILAFIVAAGSVLLDYEVENGWGEVEEDFTDTTASMTEDAALASVPTAVAALYQQRRASSTLDALVGVETGARTDRDLLAMDCKARRAQVLLEAKAAHTSAKRASNRYARVAARVAQLQGEVQRQQAQAEALHSQYEDAKKQCDAAATQGQATLTALVADLPLAAGILQWVTTQCAGGTAPGLVQCAMTDGSVVTSLADLAVRKQIAGMSPMSERIMALALERAAFGSSSSKQIAFLDISMDLHTVNIDGGAAVPLGSCKAAPAPTCDVLLDHMTTAAGEVKDSGDELRERLTVEAARCDKKLEVQHRRIHQAAAELGSVRTMLADASAQVSGEAQEVTAADRIAADTRRKARQSGSDCRAQVRELQRTMEASKTLRAGLVKFDTSIPAVGSECEVSDWIPGECSATCGGGFQTLTREVITYPSGSAACPVLQVKRPCNTGACPVDCILSPFTQWSECTKQCGAGTQQRMRQVVVQPSDDGLPCPDLIQQRLCNIHPCDANCRLGAWSTWSSCSKQCGTGHRVRSREVVQPARGEGSCPSTHSPFRFQREACNTTLCGSSVTCDVPLDVALVLDSSGSVTEAGFGKMKAYVTELAKALNVAPKKTQLGVIAFGARAEVATGLSGDVAAITKAVGQMQWLKGATTLPVGLALAEEVLQAGRPGVPSVAVLVTDGMPVSKYLTETQVTKLQATSRFYIAAVGNALNPGVLRQWVSWPASENYQVVTSFAALSGSINATVANLCSNVTVKS
mmetsp:Transcript_35950/g.86566  ORF Transcript_35950/g.86566 Transcript_35950/m.86566 type:complete len:751 (+) Transcript_35950:52-2304(+)